MNGQNDQRIVFVSGLSGSGKTTLRSIQHLPPLAILKLRWPWTVSWYRSHPRAPNVNVDAVCVFVNVVGRLAQH